MKKILFLGTTLGSYRSQNTIKIFLDRVSDYQIVYQDNRFFKFQIHCKKIICKIFRKLINFNASFFTFFVFIPKLIASDIVYILAMNHSNYLISILLAKLFRKQIIIDYYISMYDTLVLDRKVVQNKFLRKKLFLKEQSIMNLADKLIFLNNAEQSYYCNLLNVKCKNAKIVPLCVDEHAFGVLPFSKGSKRVPVICWWGSYIPLHGIDNIIDSVTILKNEGFYGKFYIFGDSEVKAIPYINKIKKLGLSGEIFVINNYTFNNGKLEKFLSKNCDLALGNFGDSQKAKTVLINKVLDAVTMKIPIVTIKTKALEEFFDFEKDINIVATGNPQEIAKAIKEVFDNYSHAVTKANNAYNVYKKYFSLKAFQDRMLKVIDES